MRFKAILVLALGVYGLSNAYAADAPKYEYKTVVLNALSFSYSQLEWDRGDFKSQLNRHAVTLESTLNEEGKAGWRLVQTLPIRAWTDRVVGYTVVFERRIE
jgi:hypothetical protein